MGALIVVIGRACFCGKNENNVVVVSFHIKKIQGSSVHTQASPVTQLTQPATIQHNTTPSVSS